MNKKTSAEMKWMAKTFANVFPNTKMLAVVGKILLF
jgi:hypothetical protein